MFESPAAVGRHGNWSVQSLVLLLLSMAVVQFIRVTFENQVTLGDLLAILSPIATALVVASVTGWRKRYPFTMRFADQPLELSLEEELHGRTFKSSKAVPEGETSILVEIRSRSETKATPFDLRFVNWRWFRWHAANPSVVKITAVEVSEWAAQAELERNMTGLNTPETTLTSVGGAQVATRIPKRWAAGQPLFISIKVAARGAWSGHLSFRATANGRSSFCRRPFRVLGYEAATSKGRRVT